MDHDHCDNDDDFLPSLDPILDNVERWPNILIMRRFRYYVSTVVVSDIDQPSDGFRSYPTSRISECSDDPRPRDTNLPRSLNTNRVL